MGGFSPGRAGGGPTVNKGQVTNTPGAIANNGAFDFIMAVPGAALGDGVLVSANPDIGLAITLIARIQVADQVAVRILNQSGFGTSIGATVWSAQALKY